MERHFRGSSSDRSMKGSKVLLQPMLVVLFVQFVSSSFSPYFFQSAITWRGGLFSFLVAYYLGKN